MAEVIRFSNGQITQLSHLFGDKIMTGSEITSVLNRVGIQDNSHHSTKWRRLEYTFIERQETDKAGNVISARRWGGISDPCVSTNSVSWVKKYVKAEKASSSSTGVYKITF